MTPAKPQHWLNSDVTLWQILAVGITVGLAVFTSFLSLSGTVNEMKGQLKVDEHRLDLHREELTSINKQLVEIKVLDGKINSQLDNIDRDVQQVQDDLQKHRLSGK